MKFASLSYDQQCAQCGAVRGFDYQPSGSAFGVITWTELDHHKTEAEIRRGQELFPYTNTLRIWLSFDAYIRDKSRFLHNVDFMLDLLGRLGLRAILVLFNNWHSIPDFGGVSPEQVRSWNVEQNGGVYLGYIDALLERYVRDERIFLWDLCNEPFNSHSEEYFLPWLSRLYQRIKEKGADAPVGVGVHPDLNALKLLEPVSDVLTPHLYMTPDFASAEDYRRFVREIAVYGREVGKPLVSTEMGWGRMDDEERAAALAIELDTLLSEGIGVCIHLLGHSLVADCHRPEFGVVHSSVGYMGCIEADGSLRIGHDVVNRFYR